MTKPSELGAGEWTKLWRKMASAKLQIPCRTHRVAMAEFDTVREYLLSLSAGETEDAGAIMADPAREYFDCILTNVTWTPLVPRDVLCGDRSARFTKAEVGRILAALRPALDTACEETS